MLWAIWTERKDMSNQEYSGAKNRVYTLYRVSTLGQVEKDDIPMQKTKCRAFAEEKGWMIIKEFAEKCVSGYKVAAKGRDAIQEIQKLPLQVNLISCWSSCLTGWAAETMKRHSWWSGSSSAGSKFGVVWRVSNDSTAMWIR
jgi:hypothetical protein